MADRVTLRDGTVGWVWPVLATDRKALAHEFETLSEESRRRRFLGPVLHLSEAMLTHLVDEVDGVDHVALVLMAEVGDDLEPIGVGRCVRYTSQPDAADVAVTIKDEWHGRGAATALLEVLMRRRPLGVTHLLTEVSSDNPASRAMLRRLGAVHELDTGMGTVDIEVVLEPGTDPLTPEPEGVRLHPVLTDPSRPRLRTRDRVCPWLRSDAAAAVEAADEEAQDEAREAEPDG